VALNTFPYFLIPFDEKVKVLSQFISSPVDSFNSLPYLFFNYRFQKAVPTIISVVYFLFIYYKCKSKQDGVIYISKNGPQLINQILVIFSINIFSSILLVLYVTISSDINSSNWLFIFSDFSTEHKGFLYFMSLVLPLSLFFSPGVLFFKIDNSELALKMNNSVSTSLKLGRNKQELITDQSEDLKCILLYIGQHKPYLNTRFSLHEISRELNIPHARVTYCFNKELNTPFPIYRNKLRVLHAETLMREGVHLTMTIEGIAAKCGFRSTSVFYAAFREVFDMTPAEWIKVNLGMGA
jgi:AraC-like DNA-binding protein